MKAVNLSELSDAKREQAVESMKITHTFLIHLDNAEPFARQTLAGLGLPTSIEEFEEYDGNNCRIKIDIRSCTLASDSVVRETESAMKAVANG
jgi:hypothetical protein